MGSKKRPFYRIVATDSRNARDGRFIETLGYYNPIVDPPDISVKEELIFKWMERGAIPSDQTKSLLKRTGTMRKWSLLKQGVSMDDLEARAEELKAKETPALTAGERKSKADAKKAAEEKVAADAAAAETAAAEAAAAEEKAAVDAAEAASAEAAEAPVEEAAPEAAESSDAEKKTDD